MTFEERKAQVKSFLGKTVVIGIDRPIGYVHRKENYSLEYPINYGYIPDVLGGNVATQQRTFRHEKSRFFAPPSSYNIVVSLAIRFVTLLIVPVLIVPFIVHRTRSRTHPSKEGRKIATFSSA